MGLIDGFTEEEVQRLCDSFIFHPHGAIVVAPSEVTLFLKGSFPDADDAKRSRLNHLIVVHASRSKDGKIDLSEFISWVRDRKIDELRRLLDPENGASAAAADGSAAEEPDAEFAQVRDIMEHLSPDELDMYRDAFIKLDANGDGMLDLAEVMVGVEAVLKARFPPMREYLIKIFEVADKDRDDMLCLREFMASFVDGPGVVPHEVILDCTALVRVRLTDDEIARLQMAFREMDTNNDGYLDRAELKAGLKYEVEAAYPRHTDAQFDELVSVVLAAADRDRDGKLNMSEFIRSFQEEQGVLPSSFMGRDDLGAQQEQQQQQQHNQHHQQKAAAPHGNSQHQHQHQQHHAHQQQHQHHRQQQHAPSVHLSKEQHAFLADAFRNMDANGDGFLDIAELRQAVTTCVLAMMPERADDADAIDTVVAAILVVADADQDGRVSTKEFYRAFAQHTAIMVDVMGEITSVAVANAAATAAAASGDQRAAAVAIRAQLTSEEVANLKQAFASLDRNGDGFVSRKELASAVKLLMQDSRVRKTVVHEVVDAIMSSADHDHDNKLSLAEFIRAFASGQAGELMDISYAAAVAADVARRAKDKLRPQQIEALKNAFAALDRNHDGFVDAHELRGALYGLLRAHYEDEAEVHALVNVIMQAGDSDHDNRLSLTEFIRAFVKHVDVMVLPVAAADSIIATRSRILSTLHPDEIEALRNAFETLDTNRDGFLTEREFSNAVGDIVQKNVRAQIVPEVVQLIMQAADTDRDHRVSFTEFLLAFAQEPEVMSAAYAAAAAKESARKAKRVLTQEQIRIITHEFHALDANHDGFISQDELEHAIRQIIEPHAENREAFVADIVDLILRAADTDADGRLTLTEFVRAFVKHAEIMEVASLAARVAHQERVDAITSRLSPQEVHKLRHTFRALDVNNDGELDRAELTAGVRKTLTGEHVAAATIEQVVNDIIASADADHNGRLSLVEFLKVFDFAPEMVQGPVGAVVARLGADTLAEEHGRHSNTNNNKAAQPPSPHAGNITKIKSKLLQSEVDSLSKIFETLDFKKDGYLDQQELENAVRATLSRGLVDSRGVNEVVAAILQAADKKHEGRVSLGDFLKAFEETPAVMNITKVAADAIQAHARLLATIPKDEYEQLRVAFAVLNKTGNGFLSRDELVRSISGLVNDSVTNKGLVERIVDLILATASQRNDGRITLEEFVQNFVTHGEILATPVLAAINELQQQQQHHNNGNGVSSSPATTAATKATPRGVNSSNVLVPVPPSTGSVSPTYSSAHRRRPGASTKELVVEASHIINDVSGVAINDEQLHLEFEQLDRDHSGKLNKEEFKKYFLALESFGLPMTHDQFEQHWSRLCGAKESMLTFERFALFMLRRSRM